MKMLKLASIVCLSLAVICFHQATAAGCNYTIHLDNPLNDEHIITGATGISSEGDCADRCSETENCKSANYIAEAQYCLLYDTQPTDRHPGVVYMYNINCRNIYYCNFAEKELFMEKYYEDHWFDRLYYVYTERECANECFTTSGCKSASYWFGWEYCDFFNASASVGGAGIAALLYNINCGGGSTVPEGQSSTTPQQ